MGITPEKYQDYVAGKISLEEASKPLAPKPYAPPATSSPTTMNMPPTPQQASQGVSSVSSPVYAPAPQFTPDQQAHQAWINNAASGQGGLENYTKTQNARFADAYKSGDQDLIGRLQADSQRVGYKLNVPAPMPVMAASVQSTPTVYAPPAAAPYGQLSPDQIKAQAQAQIQKQVQDRLRIANQTKAGYQTSYDRMNKTIGEDRTLQDAAFQRNSNPFSGRTSYDKGITNLQRERTDRENQQDLQTRLGSVDTQLGDFLNQTPEQQQQIVNDLTRQEREYGLQVGTLTGNLQGYGRTLAGNAQDFNQNMANQQFDWQKQMDMAGLTGQFNGDSTLAGKQANLNAALQVGNQLGQVIQPKSDWSQLYNQTDAPLNYQAARDAIGDEQYKQKFDEDVRRYGLEYAMKQADQANQFANRSSDNARAAASEARAAGNQQLGNLFDIWDRTGVAPAGIPGVAEGTPINKGGSSQNGNFKLDDYKGYIDKNFYTETVDPNTYKPVKSFDSAGARKYIISLGLPDEQTDQVLKLYGLPTN